MRVVVRIGWFLMLAGLPLVGGAMAGRVGIAIGATLALVQWLYGWLWLPRSAHAAFEAGTFTRAERRYRALALLAASQRRVRAARLSRAGCLVAIGRLADADVLLAAIDPVDTSERAVWLNNRACAQLAASTDPHAALALVEEASSIRPDVPALQHTRGMALLAVGRTDDAIAVLDAMRAAGELPPRLEAERCRDLARAWSAKGEAAYAQDYEQRARSLAR